MRDGGGDSIFVQAQYCLGLTWEIKTFLTLSCQNRPVFTKGCFQLDLHTTSTVLSHQILRFVVIVNANAMGGPSTGHRLQPREEPREGGVLWSHDKILSLLFIYSSSGSHCSQGPITLWITVDLSPCGHMVCSSHRAEYIWKNTHIMYCGIFPSRRSELNFLLSRVRVEVLALLLSVE